MDPRKSGFLVFEENPPKKFVSSFFGFDSALKTIDAQMFFWSVFLKTQKKIIDHQKRHFGRFWRLITFFGVFKNTDQKNSCASIVFKAKTKEKYEENFFLQFLFQNSKMLFFGEQPICFQFFFLQF